MKHREQISDCKHELYCRLNFFRMDLYWEEVKLEVLKEKPNPWTGCEDHDRQQTRVEFRLLRLDKTLFHSVLF